MSAVPAALRTAVVLVASWQVIVIAFAPPRYILPAPLDVAAAFHRQPLYLLDNALVTLAEIAAGFMAGTLAGIVTALGIASFPRLGRAVWPIVLVLQAFPVFVIAPLLVLWFGFGMASKVVMTSLIIFFPVASAFADGLRRTPPEIVDAAALTPASHRQTLFLLRVPLAIPALVSGLRVAAPLAPLGAVIGEWVGASAGLGFVMVQANARMQTDTMFAAMAFIAVLTLMLRRAVDALSPFLTPWAREGEFSSDRKQRKSP
ncbi:ABC transporter permease [Aquamicrobium defluvii]|uniref:ABC transporter permease n=1 Tax=Aquamicrobium defluvii TaxID=69279 RepID=A0A011TYV4_9HYPH|nr:ABC transporter permease [Aquamicrobium defluvii]EXL09317.1 ABC transporter permease [Aquamicrobium defluvii]EZQ15481.1 ABC transporter permease [Halopseudomonas bauzanensis]TDR36153.1 putative hydroxymethylpyrimidine transport system permease protein [Aquamicrobium defluvii]